MNAEYMYAALHARVGNPHQKLVLLAIASVSDQYGEWRGSHKELGHLVEINQHRIPIHLEGLRRKWLVKITRIDGRRGRFDSIISLRLPNIKKRPQL